MQTALIFGGTRFIGVHLVRELLQRGVRVTLVTRGRLPLPFGGQVRHVISDRSKPDILRAGLRDGRWDVCFDQIGFNGDDVRAACELLAGRVARYVLTSSAVVYGFGSAAPHAESEFHAAALRERPGRMPALSYVEAKQQAERALATARGGASLAVRLPMILGTDDPTRKLQLLLADARAGRHSEVISERFVTNYLPVDETARFLVWAAESRLEGAVNAASDRAVTLEDIANFIETKHDVHCRFAVGPERAGLTPIAIPGALLIDNTRARQSGFAFAPIDSWLPELIEDIGRRS